jgi:hypothetical protein
MSDSDAIYDGAAGGDTRARRVRCGHVLERALPDDARADPAA